MKRIFLAVILGVPLPVQASSRDWDPRFVACTQAQDDLYQLELTWCHDTFWSIGDFSNFYTCRDGANARHQARLDWCWDNWEDFKP